MNYKHGPTSHTSVIALKRINYAWKVLPESWRALTPCAAVLHLSEINACMHRDIWW